MDWVCDNMKNIKVITDSDFNLEPMELNNPRVRIAARGLVFNDENKIAILNKQVKNEYKLVGGGVEGDEDPKTTFEREVLEEAGCIIQIEDCIGTIKEERSRNNIKQTSYIYRAHVLEDTKHLNLTEKEKAEGAQLLWLDIEEALNLMKACEENLKPSSYEDIYLTKFVVRRDYYILEYYKKTYLS